MKRHWQIRRQFQPTADAAQRWDQVYQYLIQWSQPTASTTSTSLPTSLHPSQEVTDDKCHLCPCLNRPASPGPNH
jgi:hypothetical protein